MSAHFSIVISILEISGFSVPFLYWTEYIVQFPESSRTLFHTLAASIQPCCPRTFFSWVKSFNLHRSRKNFIFLVLCVNACCVGNRDLHEEHCFLHVLKLNSLENLGYLPMLTCRLTSESRLHSALTGTKGKSDLQFVTYSLRTEVPWNWGHIRLLHVKIISLYLFIFLSRTLFIHKTRMSILKYSHSNSRRHICISVTINLLKNICDHNDLINFSYYQMHISYTVSGNKPDEHKLLPTFLI